MPAYVDRQNGRGSGDSAAHEPTRGPVRAGTPGTSSRDREKAAADTVYTLVKMPDSCGPFRLDARKVLVVSRISVEIGGECDGGLHFDQARLDRRCARAPGTDRGQGVDGQHADDGAFLQEGYGA